MLNYFACTLAVDRADGERKYLTGSFSPTLYGITMRSNSDSISHKAFADRQGNFPNWHVRPRGLLGIPTLFSERFFCILLSKIVSFLSYIAYEKEANYEFSRVKRGRRRGAVNSMTNGRRWKTKLKPPKNSKSRKNHFVFCCIDAS